MRFEKKYTQKEWAKFKQFIPKIIGDKTYYLDVQELMCKKYNIILTDYKTKKEKKKNFLKKFNMKNFNNVMTNFNNTVQSIGSSMDLMTREMSNDTKKHNDYQKLQSKKNQKNVTKLIGKATINVKIWSDSPKIKSYVTKDQINLEKIWGKQKWR